MRFGSPPRPIEPGVYEEAIERYARLVKTRTLALYEVGHPRYPGLSDIDLLLVPVGRRLDNAAYFNVSIRLPPALRRPFLHEPTIVPSTTPGILTYTTHARRRLVVGEDLLEGVVPRLDAEASWSHLCEDLCNFAAYRAIAARGGARMRFAISVASSLRFTLADLDRVAGGTRATDYALEIDALRARFFDDPEPAAREIWERFGARLTAFESEVRAHVGADDVAEFAHAFLAGHRRIPGLSEVALNKRRAAVADYQTEIRRLGFEGSDLFFSAAYRERFLDLARRFRLPRSVARPLNAWYRLRRRFGL